MQTAKLNNLTFARFLAALLVIFHHAPNVLQNPMFISQGWLRMFFSNGYVGVTFFFIRGVVGMILSIDDMVREPDFTGALIFFPLLVIRIVPVWLHLSPLN